MKVLKLSALAPRSANCTLSLQSKVNNRIYSQLPVCCYVPIGKTGLIIRDFSRLLVQEEDVAMQTYNNSCEIMLQMEGRVHTVHNFAATITSLVSSQGYPLLSDSIHQYFIP